MKIPALFLQAVIIAIGLGALIFLIGEPLIEGRNANATSLFQVYFNDPFLAYAYTASISFFVGLYQVYKIVGFVRENKTFSPETLTAVRVIKKCGLIIIVFVVPALAYLFIVRPGDDIAGGVFIGLLVTSASLIVTTVATKLERILWNLV